MTLHHVVVCPWKEGFAERNKINDVCFGAFGGWKESSDIDFVLIRSWKGEKKLRHFGQGLIQHVPVCVIVYRQCFFSSVFRHSFGTSILPILSTKSTGSSSRGLLGPLGRWKTASKKTQANLLTKWDCQARGCLQISSTRRPDTLLRPWAEGPLAPWSGIELSLHSTTLFSPLGNPIDRSLQDFQSVLHTPPSSFVVNFGGIYPSTIAQGRSRREVPPGRCWGPKCQ